MSDNYSLIIMRDSSQKVRRLRINTQVIKFGLIFLLLLALLVSGGIIFSFHSIGQFASLSNKNTELKTSLAEAQMQLERLQNVETFLKNSEEVALNQTPLDKDSSIRDLPKDQTAEINTQEVVATVFPETVNETTEATTSEEADSTPTISPSAIATVVVDSPAKISDVDISVRSPKSVRLSFDLNNETPGVTLTGNVQLSLVTKQGKIHKLIVPRQNMIFQINYYKRMDTAFPLPEGVALADIKSLRLMVTANGKELQTDIVPFPELD